MVMYNFAEGSAEDFSFKIDGFAFQLNTFVFKQWIINIVKFNRFPFNIPKSPCSNLWILNQNSMDFLLKIHNHPCPNQGILIQNR